MLSPKLIGLCVLALLLSPISALQGQVVHPTEKEFRGSGYLLRYNISYFSGCQSKAEPRLTTQENGSDYPDGIAPARVKFSLQMKTPEFAEKAREWDKSEATIFILPTTDQSVPSFKKAYPFFFENIARVKRFTNIGTVKAKINENLPDWNQGDCSQAIHSKTAVIETPWCKGLQYITECLQEAAEIDNGRLYYKFEGISNDGRFFVSVEVPLANSLLPFAAPGIDSAEGKTVNVYFLKSQKRLNEASDASYFPTLQVISDLVQSISAAK